MATLLVAATACSLAGCVRIPFLQHRPPVPRVAEAHDDTMVAVRDVTDDSTTVLPDTADARRPLGLPAKPKPRPSRRPAADSTDSVPVAPVEGVMTAEDRQKATARVVADTTAAGQAMRKCAGRALLPDQESVYDTVRGLLAQTGAALQSGELWRAESLARKARQLAASLSCP